MNYILDIIVILIIVLGVIQGAQKGFVRAIMSLVGVVVAFFLASFVSQISSDYVYEKVVRGYIIDTLNAKTDEVLDQYDPTQIINETLAEYFGDDNDALAVIKDSKSLFEFYNNADLTSIIDDENLIKTLDKIFADVGVKITESMENIVPNEIVDNAKKYFSSNEHSIAEKLDMLTVSKQSFAEKIESVIIRPFVVKIIGYIIFTVVFALVTLLFNIIGKALKIVDYLPAINKLNSFFGGLLGALKSLVFLAVIVLVCNIFISLTGDENTVISTTAIAQTHVFKWVYYGMFSLLQTYLLK